MHIQNLSFDAKLAFVCKTLKTFQCLILQDFMPNFKNLNLCIFSLRRIKKIQQRGPRTVFEHPLKCLFLTFSLLQTCKHFYSITDQTSLFPHFFPSFILPLPPVLFDSLTEIPATRAKNNSTICLRR